MTVKLASFFLLSLSLHAAALTCPILFLMSAEKPLTPVQVVVLEPNENVSRQTHGVGSAESGSPSLKRRNQNSSTWQPNRATEKPTELRNPVFVSSGTPDADKLLVVDSEESSAPITPGVFSTQPGGQGTVVAGSGGAGNPGGTGSGLPGVDGSGRLSFAQASYAYSPQPKYPERARSEGWEGTVLLRILVDENGKAKSLQVNHSSGFEALDNAAVETVRHWRFYPAHYGERRVESWVKIPIIFRLADLKD